MLPEVALHQPVFWLLTVFLLLVSALYVFSSSSRRNHAVKPEVSNPAKAGHTGDSDGSQDEYEHEMSVPFPVGDVRVSKILVHPIKSCRGTSVSEARYTPQGLEVMCFCYGTKVLRGEGISPEQTTTALCDLLRPYYSPCRISPSNDRRWCIVNTDSNAVITAREFGKMVLIAPRIVPDSSSTHGGKLVISFPEDSGCETFAVPLNPTDDVLLGWTIINNTLWGSTIDGYICEALAPSMLSPSAVLSTYLGRSVHLVMKGPRPRECKPTLGVPDLQATTLFQDGYPLLVASEESLQLVQDRVRAAARKDPKQGHIGGLDEARWHEGELHIERFRPNIVLKGSGVPFAEDMWREVVISPDPALDPASAPPAQTITLVSKCTRCLLPNVDIATGVRDAAVPFKVLMKFRTGKDPARMNQSCFGCNAVYGGEGVLHVGDCVRVKAWAESQGV